MSKTAFDALISDFGKSIGMPATPADDGSYVALTSDEMELHLQFDDKSNEIVIFIPLGEAGPEHAAEIYSTLLGANLFWYGSQGTTFSVLPKTQLVFMADRQRLAGMSLARLNGWLEGFLDTATSWRKWLESANEGGSPENPMADEGQRRPADDAKVRTPDFRVNRA